MMNKQTSQTLHSQNLYFVPFIQNQTKYIILITAQSESEAYIQASIETDQFAQKYTDAPYTCIPALTVVNIPTNLPKTFPYSLKYDILKSILTTLNLEDMYMDVYDYMYWGDYNLQIQSLADKALPEKWSFENKDDNYILKNYLKYTFIRLLEENKVIETDTYCVFNTGLFSKYYEPIYVYGELNRNVTEDSPKWYFKGFKDQYELGSLDVLQFPERANYFSDPSRLVFNYNYKVNKNYKHILDDLNTSNRLPELVKNSERPLDMLKGVIDTSIQKIIANYKLAIPHYYQNKIQLLVPLYFTNDDKPDNALVLDLMSSGYYQATTCLSLEMAYVDARLIAKPESTWLDVI